MIRRRDLVVIRRVFSDSRCFARDDPKAIDVGDFVKICAFPGSVFDEMSCLRFQSADD